MIKYIKRKNIDTKKYDDCIEKALNSRVYAFSWYLDIVADNWDVLVLNDYEAVMPLPWRRKYLIKYVYPPCWTQQLGVFSTVKIESELVKLFLKSIPKKFMKATMQLNSRNNLGFNLKKINYVLSLNNNYESIRNNFRKDRKDRLKKIKKSNSISLKKTTIEAVIELFINYYDGIKRLPGQDYDKLKLLVKGLKKKTEVIGVFDDKDKLISGALFLIDNRRITYLFSASSTEGKKQQSTTAVINYLLEEYSESEYVFDFEGSVIPGIASFFKSFGAEKEIYYTYSDKIYNLTKLA